VSAVQSSDLPQAIKEELKNARKYTEGRGLRIDVKSAKDVKNIQKLVQIKVKN
jgi:signal transduction histidine kinase